MAEKKYPFYVGEPQVSCAETAATLPFLKRDRQHEARTYKADPDLVDAVNVALLLGQPLLLTGEPGTGKTQLAYSLECQFKYTVLPFNTKSTSLARELFYSYDTLGRYHAVQLELDHTPDPKDFIVYNALGEAILRSREWGEVKDLLPEGFKHRGKERSIVLIDEIDKAPRDFPNDILHEIEEMSFSVPELGRKSRKIVADEELRPVVVITSNSEKSLPDAFLRRCIYYNIAFPDDPELLREHLRDIALARLTSFEGKATPWLEDALNLFIRLRDPKQRLEKPPATAELLNWLTFLLERIERPQANLWEQEKLLTASFGSILKTAADRERGEFLFKEWRKGRPG